MKNKALETIVLRNEFYRDNYKSSIIVLLVVLFINVVLFGAIFYKVTHPVPPRYFAATNDGRLISMHPLSDPVKSDDFVLQWASLAARRAFDLDFVHWQEQMTAESSYFTADGWSDFSSSLKKTNNLKTLVELQMVATAEITGAPQIVQKAVIDGHYAWSIRVPVLVKYISAKKTITQTLMLTLVVVRQSIADYPAGIAINNYIADVQGGDG